MEAKCKFKKDKPDEKRHKIIITGNIHQKKAVLLRYNITWKTDMNVKGQVKPG